MKEVWKQLPGYEDYIWVSNFGSVKSQNKLLNQNLSSRGYYMVTVCKEGTEKYKSVHRLVALTFIKNTNNKPHVNHKDGNKLNNIVSNLEWCTHQENMQHAWDNGLMNYTKHFKFPPEVRKFIANYPRYHKYKEYLSKKFNISYATITKIKREMGTNGSKYNYKN